MSDLEWESISSDDKEAIIQAFKSSNNRLFTLTCQSFGLDVHETTILINTLINKQIKSAYHAASFKQKQQMKHIHIEYTGNKFTQQAFITKLKEIFETANSDNIHIIENLIGNDDIGLYPNSIAYKNRESTKKPKKSMRKELLNLYPSRMVEKDALTRIRILYQMQEEIDQKVDNYLDLIVNEVDFRIEINAFLHGFDKKFTKCIIKSRKISSIEQLLAHTSRKNKERDTNWRSDDMLTCEILLKKMRQECELKTSKIRNRAVDLNIATIVENSLKIKTRRIMFGTITPKSIYMEYNLMLIRVKNKLSKVQELINKLSSVDVRDYIGNGTMKERS
eukprot:97478_1